jgi:hypothetical protein
MFLYLITQHTNQNINDSKNPINNYNPIWISFQPYYLSYRNMMKYFFTFKFNLSLDIQLIHIYAPRRKKWNKTIWIIGQIIYDTIRGFLNYIDFIFFYFYFVIDFFYVFSFLVFFGFLLLL